MINTTRYGVHASGDLLGASWHHHAATIAAIPADAANAAGAAPSMRKRRAAAATIASVNRGTI
jgi:hypothetical protein